MKLPEGKYGGTTLLKNKDTKEDCILTDINTSDYEFFKKKLN
jgi:hypothetical protein